MRAVSSAICTSGDPVSLSRWAHESGGQLRYHGADARLDLGGRRIFVVHYPEYGHAMACTGDWDLVWSFVCDGDGYYSVDPEEANDRAYLIGPTGDRTNKGVEHYHDPGRWHLTVITGPNCSWNLRAVTA